MTTQQPPGRAIALALGAATLAIATTMTFPGAHASALSAPLVSVIVRENAGSTLDAGAVTAAFGGRVTNRLEIINGFSAQVPASALVQFARVPGILSVSTDSRGHLLGTYDPTSDTGSLSTTEQRIGANAAWNAGYTGKGVDIALIDSGVAPVNGLTTPGKIINGPDFSLESAASNLRYLDTYGHGTHIAGIIAGRDNGYGGESSGDSGSPSSGTAGFLGVAPDARIVSLKVADSHGNTDVSQILVAIDWVVRHRNDRGMNIRVLNLSYGTDATQDYSVDPLAYAAEAAWRAGIVVVAAAGNTGDGTALADPAYDPTILAVGAATAPATTDQALLGDSVASFSNALSTAARNVDLVAPGSHIQSLRDPGSYVDQTHGATGRISSRFFRGSGTSQATAIATGAAALVIQQHPGITPDQVKALLDATATPINGAAYAQGNGELNIAAALSQAVPDGTQSNALSTGLGTINGSRGTALLTQANVLLTGDQDVFGNTMTAQELVQSTAGTRTALDSSWLNGSWSGRSWAGTAWSISSGDWVQQLWSGADWADPHWSSHVWSPIGWISASWSSASWSSASWSSGSWSSASWSSASWSSASWSSASWSSASWSSASWSSASWSGSGYSSASWSRETWG
ncbi:MAG: S8 family serine peptidase [Candidatus Dormibacter sp.]